MFLPSINYLKKGTMPDLPTQGNLEKGAKKVAGTQDLAFSASYFRCLSGDECAEPV